MLARIARVTWQRPKLVLALVGVFVVLAAALGRDVEDHLKAAGFTDSASESEPAARLSCSATSPPRIRRATGASLRRTPREGLARSGSMSGWPASLRASTR